MAFYGLIPQNQHFQFDLTLSVPMECPIKSVTDKSGWSIVYIEGSRVVFSKKYCISFSEDGFVLANHADPDEMPHYVALHLGLHCLPKYPTRGFCSPKG